MDISLAGRVALITGGSKGLGLAMATRFAASGAHVVIAARNRETLDAAATSIAAGGKGKVSVVTGDVARAEDCRRIYDEAMKAAGKIDILVNNAGQSRAVTLENLTDEMLQEDLDQKLFAAVRLTRLVWPQMKERKWGRVINVLGTVAKAPRPATLPTSLSRSAGMALTKIISYDGAPFNVLVNCLLVGFIESDQHVRTAARRGIPLEQFMAERGKTVPLGRAGTGQEFAQIACFLASDASSYITGTAINVDGGFCAIP